VILPCACFLFAGSQSRSLTAVRPTPAGEVERAGPSQRTLGESLRDSRDGPGGTKSEESWLGGEVEMAEEAVFGGQDVDAGEEVLQAVEGGGAFGGEQVGFAFFAGVVPAL